MLILKHLVNPVYTSRAVKDPGQFVCMLAFAVEGGVDGREGFGEREDVARDQ